MIKIAICDDEKKLTTELEDVLINMLDGLNVKSEIDVYYSGKELCRHLEKGTHYDLIYLDIEFAQGEINGVKVARIIRDVYENDYVSIVFISWEQGYAMQLFEIQPLDFLTKPLKYEEIKRTVHNYLKKANISLGVFTYKIGHDTHNINIKEIIYVEVKDRKLTLYLTNNRTVEFYGSLKDIYEKHLKKHDFIYIHASFLVNYDHVQSINYSELTVTDKKMSLPISQSKGKKARDDYYNITVRRR